MTTEERIAKYTIEWIHLYGSHLPRLEEIESFEGEDFLGYISDDRIDIAVPFMRDIVALSIHRITDSPLDEPLPGQSWGTLDSDSFQAVMDEMNSYIIPYQGRRTTIRGYKGIKNIRTYGFSRQEK
jgi:hypothetical protein